MKKTVLYFCQAKSSFVKNDIAYLSGSYTVKVFLFKPKAKALTPFTFISQKLSLLRHIFSADYLVCFFGGYHTFLPSLYGKLFNKPCLIVVGGTDCVSFPSIGYGNFSKPLLGKVTKWSYQMASHISPVHKSLVEYDYTYDDADFKKQGFKYFCPNLKTPYTVINFGFEPIEWKRPISKIPNTFITVAAGLNSTRRMKLKGVDLILEAAASFPQAKFIIIGCPENYKLPIKSENIKTYSYVPDEQLKELFNQSEFYIQASMSEGFPNAICEAMLCGCIPIGSNVGGIPDIIGDAGFVLDKRDNEKFKALLQNAMACDKETYSKKAVQRITINYPIELRKNELLSLLSKLTN